jgi:hypothetical protein
VRRVALVWQPEVRQTDHRTLPAALAGEPVVLQLVALPLVELPPVDPRQTDRCRQRHHQELAERQRRPEV